MEHTSIRVVSTGHGMGAYDRAVLRIAKKKCAVYEQIRQVSTTQLIGAYPVSWLRLHFGESPPPSSCVCPPLLSPSLSTAHRVAVGYCNTTHTPYG
eukprot:132057-Rhodomonas_salina.1